MHIGEVARRTGVREQIRELRTLRDAMRPVMLEWDETINGASDDAKQKATAHHFILSKDGGRIEVSARSGSDTKSPGEIRAHLGHIAQPFTSGDFSVAALVHDQNVPGVARMQAAGTALTYVYEETERGGLIRISGSTPRSVLFQRTGQAPVAARGQFYKNDDPTPVENGPSQLVRDLQQPRRLP